MREIRQSGLTRGEAAAIVLPLSYSTVQPIRLLVLPVQARPWELTVCPRSYN